MRKTRMISFSLCLAMKLRRIKIFVRFLTPSLILNFLKMRFFYKQIMKRNRKSRNVYKAAELKINPMTKVQITMPE